MEDDFEKDFKALYDAYQEMLKHGWGITSIIYGDEGWEWSMEITDLKPDPGEDAVRLYAKFAPDIGPSYDCNIPDNERQAIEDFITTYHMHRDIDTLEEMLRCAMKKTIVNQEFDMIVKDGVVPDMDIDKAQEIISELKEHGWPVSSYNIDGNGGLLLFVSEEFSNPVSIFIGERICFGPTRVANSLSVDELMCFIELAKMIKTTEDIETIYMLSKAEEPLNIIEGNQQVRLDYKEATE